MRCRAIVHSDLDRKSVATSGSPCPAKLLWRRSVCLRQQYSQMVIFVFNGVRLTHITVATLTLSNG